MRVDLLLDVVFHRHEEQRFAKPGGFADGFKTGGANDVAAFGHHLQKFFAVQLVKRERGRMLKFRRARRACRKNNAAGSADARRSSG